MRMSFPYVLISEIAEQVAPINTEQAMLQRKQIPGF